MNFVARRQARAELKKLLQGRPDFTVHTPRQLIASALWDYGEDALAARALAMSEDERAKVDQISAWYEEPDYPLPMTGQRITHNHVAAFAAIFCRYPSPKTTTVVVPVCNAFEVFGPRNEQAVTKAEC